MASFDLSRFADTAQDRFGRQFSSLARDTQHLSDALARYASHSRRDIGNAAHDFADEAMHSGAAAARFLGKRAWKAGKAVRKDPAPTVAAMVGLACLVTLVMSSGSSRR